MGGVKNVLMSFIIGFILMSAKCKIQSKFDCDIAENTFCWNDDCTIFFDSVFISDFLHSTD
jgi:hypothetical protein